MSLAEFYEELKAHDWSHQFSDDQNVWRAGVANHQRLQKISRDSVAHLKLFEGFLLHHYEGKPLPEKPA